MINTLNDIESNIESRIVLNKDGAMMLVLESNDPEVVDEDGKPLINIPSDVTVIFRKW